ncbi:MAG: amidase [Alphaproteobacteria bacterium]|nr:amidase [Alphaproteobacteria bacterium]
MSFNPQAHPWGDWKPNSNHTAVTREWSFESFGLAMVFLNRVADIAHAHDHHPDIRNVYNRVQLTLSTHDAGGLTERDARLAQAIDALLLTPSAPSGPTVSEQARCFIPYPTVLVSHRSTGPLSGLTFAAKDLFHVAGYPTGGGQPFVLARSGIKSRNAVTVQKLLDAGARFVGKVVTDELAFSMNGQNAHFGNPVNGAAPDRITGGSSSGSASAVSNSLCDFALGTDTGGSVRAPANHCGLYGLRPTHGRVSLEGALDLSPSFDTCGWFTRDIGTFSRVADVLLGADAQSLPNRIRLLMPTDIWGLLHADVRTALEPALGRLTRAHGQPQALDGFFGDFDALYWAFRFIQGREAWATDGDLISRYQPPLGPSVKERFEWSRKVTDEQVSQSWLIRSELTQRLSDLLGDDGVLVMPTMPDAAPLISQPESELENYRNSAVRMLCVSGLTGLPQLSMPLAQRHGAPLGLSLLGPKGRDRSLIRLAEAL